MLRGRWRATGSALLRLTVVWAVSTLTMLVLAEVLPDFRLQSGDDDSITQIGLAAAWGAGAFGLLGALVWPLLVRALLLVPALVLGLLVFFLNGSLLLLALRLVPDGRGEAAPETAVVVAAVMSAVASATSTALAVRDDEAYRRRLYRLADRRRRGQRRAAGPGAARTAPGMLFLQLDGVGYEVLRAAAADGLMPTVAGWLDHGHRLTSWRTDWSSQTGASQLGILHGSNFDVPAFRWYEKETGEVMVCNRPTSAAELQLRAIERTRDGGCSPSTGPAAATSSAAAPTSWPWCCPCRRGGAGPTAPARATSRTSATRRTPSAPPCPSSPRCAGRSASRYGRGCAGTCRGWRAPGCTR
ncbi:hypothetical protein GCM10020254_20760 [Streptomyces goshikiensis]